MARPQHDLILSWHNLDVYQGSKSSKPSIQKKHLLINVSGELPSGHSLAIMGPSGAGKTTFLNVLTGRNIRRLIIQGSVRVNGRNMGGQMRRISAYVQQDDLFLGTLTAREHLSFQAKLRMKSHISKEDRKKRVQEILEEMGLTRCADTKIGIPGKLVGISGGERKRLACASELLNSPRILFCDEPTSGLDSSMAQSVVNVIHAQAAKGCAAVYTIHQPSSAVYNMFDLVCFLADGRVVYLGEARKVTEYFAKLNYVCPPNFNPPDFVIDLLGIVPGNEARGREVVKSLNVGFERNVRQRTSQEIFESLEIPEMDKEKVTCNLPICQYPASMWTQFATMLLRSFLSILRMPVLTWARLGQMAFLATILGIVYYQQKLNQAGIININGSMFLMLLMNSLMNLSSVTTIMCGEMPLMMREYKNGLYCIPMYFMGKTMSEVPVFILSPIIFISIAYPLVGLRWEWSNFFEAVIILILVVQASCSWGYLISAMTDDADLAATLGPATSVPFVIFGGFFLRTSNTPKYLRWITEISWYNYGFKGLASSQWAGIQGIDCETLASACITTGDMVLEMLGYEHVKVMDQVINLLVVFLVIRLFAMLCLMLKARFY